MDHLTGEAVVVIRHLAVEGEVLALLVLVRLTSKLFIRVSEKGAERPTAAQYRIGAIATFSLQDCLPVETW